MAIKAPKGTKDMMPEDAYKWHYIEDAFFKICDEYGFGELRTPIFEDTNLFNRGVGETTDIVQKEMYTFEDLGHRSITPGRDAQRERTALGSRIFTDRHRHRRRARRFGARELRPRRVVARDGYLPVAVGPDLERERRAE